MIPWSSKSNLLRLPRDRQKQTDERNLRRELQEKLKATDGELRKEFEAALYRLEKLSVLDLRSFFRRVVAISCLI